MTCLGSSIDLAIIGAGPHALTLATHLLQKRDRLRGKFWVFDPSGEWLNNWNQQFSTQEIEHLRSPVVHHPDPFSGALRNFATGRASELYPPYDLPGAQLFEAFCQTVIKRWHLQDVIIPLRVEALEVRSQPLPFMLATTTSTIQARRVILATGAGRPKLPNWAVKTQMEMALMNSEAGRTDCSSPSGGNHRLCHSSQVNLQTLPTLQGQHILIVGGGLSSGHLALGAIRRGAQVTLMTRRPCRDKLFDADPGWLGPKYLKGFNQEPCWEKRWHMIQQARDGGSFTPPILAKLRRLGREGKVSWQESCEVQQAVWQGQSWQVECSGGLPLKCDRIWLATGSEMDAQQHPLLQSIQHNHPTPIIGGLPVLDQHLRWPGLELFITGGLAALQVGPAARNLHGARMAAERIVPAIVKSSLARPLRG